MANIPSFLGIQPLISHRFRLSGAGTLGAEVRLGGPQPVGSVIPGWSSTYHPKGPKGPRAWNASVRLTKLIRPIYTPNAFMYSILTYI